MAERKTALSKSPSTKRGDKKKRKERREERAYKREQREMQRQGERNVAAVGQEVTQSVQDFLNQAQSQGAFNPGEYDDLYQSAFQNVMDNFEIENSEQFRDDELQLEQMIAERGLDPMGAGAAKMRDQMYKSQDRARQQAMLTAEQAGRALQGQRFDQELARYNVPIDQAAKLGSFFGVQSAAVEQEKQRQWEANQAKLERQARASMARGGGGGGPDPFALMAAEYGYKRDLLYDQAALQAAQEGKSPSAWNQAIGGFATGVGAGITRGALS
jgi:hypothetical protein